MNSYDFRDQIREDINWIQDQMGHWNDKIHQEEYAFNYWVLENIYSMDLDYCHTNITDYNDKGLDCFAHFELDKELYLIQNKYYSSKSKLSSKDVSDFLTRPRAVLNENEYTRNQEIQKLYNKASKDNDYKIFLDFYVTSNNKHDDISRVIKDFNRRNNEIARIFYLDDIKDLYFGQSFRDNPKLETSIRVKNKATYLAIRPEEYDLPNMSEAYYIMAKVVDVYRLWEKAQQEEYPLFEENIREYLGGGGGINKAILTTLRDENQRGNFFYFNNGITIICDEASGDSKKVDVVNPQIVNGCQTVNSIAEVLKNDDEYIENFKDVYVMLKVLVLTTKEKDLYQNIVRYTNSQNAIGSKVFGASKQSFFTIQEKLSNYGILLVVLPSDKHKFTTIFKDAKRKSDILVSANEISSPEFYEFNKIKDVEIQLETLLQIIGAFEKDAYLAYTKKSYLLKPTNQEYYQNFSLKVTDMYTIESMCKIILLYKKSEQDKKMSGNNRTPSAYYLLNFLGRYLEKEDIDKQTFLKDLTIEELSEVYHWFKDLSQDYLKEYEKKYNDSEYNSIIKQQIDIQLVDEILDENFQRMERYSPDNYKSLRNIFA